MTARRPLILAATLGLLVGLAAPTPAEAGAWTRAFLDYYAKVGADFYRAGSYVDPGTGETYEDDFFGHQYSLYGELGLSPKLPIQVSMLLPLSVGTRTFTTDQFEDDGRATATSIHPGDLRAALQVAILRKTVQLSVQAQAKVPLYANNDIASGFGPYQTFFPLPGDGQVDIAARLLAGTSLPRGIGWVEGSLGYLFRTEAFIGWDTDLEFVDGLVFDFRAGFTRGPLTGMVTVDGVKNLKDDQITREGVAVGGGVLLALGRGISLEGRLQGEVWTRNAPQGLSFGFGVSAQPPGSAFRWRDKARTRDAEPAR